MAGGLRCILLLSSLCWALPARAADPAVQAAKTHYQDGTKRYNLGDYEQALSEFKAAYLAKPDPVFLFNIGQCQRQLGQWELAEKSYRGYLRESPDMPAENREQVKKLVAEMEAAVRDNRAKQPPQGTLPPEPNPTRVVEPATPPPAPSPVVTPVVVATPAPPAHTPAYKKWWVWTIVGVVVVGAGVGLGVGLTQGAVSYPSTSTTGGTVRF
jgi:tetratricopeptide (TPR) repeat protein